MKKPIAGKNDRRSLYSRCFLKDFDVMAEIEDDALNYGSCQVRRGIPRRQAMPGRLQMRIPVRRTLAVKKRNEDWQILRVAHSWRLDVTKNCAAPLQHVAAVITGASEEVLIPGGSITKRSGNQIENRHGQSLACPAEVPSVTEILSGELHSDPEWAKKPSPDPLITGIPSGKPNSDAASLVIRPTTSLRLETGGSISFFNLRIARIS